MYENLTAYHLLDGASTEAIQSILVGGITELDPNRVGTCCEVLTERDHLHFMLEAIHKSKSIFLPSAAAKVLAGCLRRGAPKLGTTAMLLSDTIEYAAANVDKWGEADFSLKEGFYLPIQYLCSRVIQSYDLREFCEIYDRTREGRGNAGISRSPELSDGGKEIAYFLQLREDYGHGTPKSFTRARTELAAAIKS